MKWTTLRQRLTLLAMAATLLIGGVQAHASVPQGTIHTAQCDEYVDIISMHTGEWLFNEATPMDGYTLYRSTFFADSAALDAYMSRVQAEYSLCEWTDMLH